MAILFPDIPFYFFQRPPIILTDYIINVKTSNRTGAATDSSVFVQLFGVLGISEPIKLDQSNHLIKFRRNQLDQFILRNECGKGLLYAIKIWHDDLGYGANWILEYFNETWHLEYVEISDIGLALTFRFPCHRWFSKSKDDGKLCRELRCTEIVQGPRYTIQLAFGVPKTTKSSLLSNVPDQITDE